MQSASCIDAQAVVMTGHTAACMLAGAPEQCIGECTACTHRGLTGKGEHFKALPIVLVVQLTQTLVLWHMNTSFSSSDHLQQCA